MGIIPNFFASSAAKSKREEKIHSYICNVSAKGNTEIHIDQICSALQLEPLQTIEELQEMIERSDYYEVLDKAYIDMNKKILMLAPVAMSAPSPVPSPAPSTSPPPASSTEAPLSDNSVTGQLKGIADGVSEKYLGRKFFGSKNPAPIIIEEKKVPQALNCPGCGVKYPATKNHLNYCEYCGAKL